MSGPFGSSQWMYASGGFYPYEIDQSVRFNDDDTAMLSKTFGSAGNSKTWTWSGWVKRGNLGDTRPFFVAGSSGSAIFQAALMTYNSVADRIQIYNYDGSYNLRFATTQLFRDVSGWYHIVLKMDTTQATSTDRFKLYINGEAVTAFEISTYPSQNFDTYVSSAASHRIGRNFDSATSTKSLDGYLAEVNFIDGTALDASSFGETKAGIWVPKNYTGSYGTNGFKLAFQDSASLGDDTSGNGHDFTSSGLASTDQMLDTPTNNYPTINGIQPHGSILSDGNLTMDNNNRVVPMLATMGVSSGKWAWKVTINTQDGWGIGISTTPRADNNSGGLGFVSYEYSYDTWDGDKRNNNTQSAYGVSVSSGGYVEVLLDLDAGTLAFKANGSDQGTAYTGLSGTFFPAFANWAASTGAGDTIDVDFGQGGYTAPSGYELLNAANLPAPGIDPAADKAPTDYFNTVTWSKTGADNSAITISGVGFEPDLVWAKGRSASMSHQWYDIVRGTGEGLSSDSTGAEVNNNTSGYISSFNTDGFTASPGSADNFYFNYQSGYTYVAWNWKAGGTAVSNTDGSITSSVSASPESGFSAVSYTGSNVGITAGHGLSSAPEMIIWKARGTPNSSARHWIVWHKDLTSTDYILYLSLTNAQTNVTAGSVLASSPTSTLFSLGTEPSVNWNSENYIAYCFHSVDGYSKVGSYTGNGSTDGPMVYTGFRPAWVMIKATGSTGGASNWRVVDSVRNTFNPEDKHLQPNTSDVEDTGSGAGYIDFLSNGFKIRTTALQLNSSGVGFIYLAFAEQPTKYANAR